MFGVGGCGVLDFGGCGEGSDEIIGLMKYCGVMNAQNSHFSFLGVAFGADVPVFNALRLRGTQLPIPAPVPVLLHF